MLVTSIFSFSNNVFYPSQNKFQFSAKFNLSSANAFNLDQSKNLSLGKELMHLQTVLTHAFADNLLHVIDNKKLSIRLVLN